MECNVLTQLINERLTKVNQLKDLYTSVCSVTTTGASPLPQKSSASVEALWDASAGSTLIGPDNAPIGGGTLSTADTNYVQGVCVRPGRDALQPSTNPLRDGPRSISLTQCRFCNRPVTR